MTALLCGLEERFNTGGVPEGMAGKNLCLPCPPAKQRSRARGLTSTYWGLRVVTPGALAGAWEVVASEAGAARSGPRRRRSPA